MSSEDTLLQTVLIIVAVIVLLPLLMMALAMPMMWFWGGGHMWNGTGAAWGSLLMWVVFLAVIVGIGYLLFRAVSSPTDREADPALEELRTAYARGDLSDEEFEQRRQRLQIQDRD